MSKKIEKQEVVAPETLLEQEIATELPNEAEENPTLATAQTVEFEQAPTEFDVERVQKKEKAIRIVRNVFVYIFLTACAFLAFLPFYMMIIMSFKSEMEYRSTTTTFFPRTFMWKNYSAVLSSADNSGNTFVQILINTLVVGLLSTTIGVVITILTAYALARLNFKGKNAVFALMLATMMIPGEMFTLGNYQLVSEWKWENSYTVLILPFLVSVYYIYLLRNNFMQIPHSLYQAAKVDGLSDMGYLVKVMVPLTAPTLTSITLLKFIGTWNSYIWPRLVNRDESWQMITNWVTGEFTDRLNFYGGRFEGGLTTLKMAAVCMVSLPLLILFITCRKYIMRGVSKSGTKG